jgi:hypothetical protein
MDNYFLVSLDNLWQFSLVPAIAWIIKIPAHKKTVGRN